MERAQGRDRMAPDMGLEPVDAEHDRGDVGGKARGRHGGCHLLGSHRHTCKRDLEGVCDGIDGAAAKDPQVVVVGPCDLQALPLQPLDDLVVVGRGREIAGDLLRVGDPLAPSDAGLHFVEVAHAQSHFEGHRRGALSGGEDGPRDHRPFARALDRSWDGSDAPREGYPGRGKCNRPGLGAGESQHHRQGHKRRQEPFMGDLRELYDPGGACEVH